MPSNSSGSGAEGAGGGGISPEDEEEERDHDPDVLFADRAKQFVEKVLAVCDRDGDGVCIVDDFWFNFKDLHRRGIIEDDEYYPVTELFSEILERWNP